MKKSSQRAAFFHFTISHVLKAGPFSLKIKSYLLLNVRVQAQSHRTAKGSLL
jgi:hypothetical protein